MKVVGIATSDSRAYYSILTRLKKTNLHFVSLTPSQALIGTHEPIITTRNELPLFNTVSIPIEDLDANPLVMEGQILSKTLENKVMLIGIDPGLRTGVVVYYGGFGLGSFTVNSIDALKSELAALVRNIPHNNITIKVGDGAPKLSRRIMMTMTEELPEAKIEIVDERGTTLSKLKSRGLTKDQHAAERIALRKGSPFHRRRD
jgi:hypothetical protein